MLQILNGEQHMHSIELLHIHGNASDAMFLYQAETEYASSSTKN